MLDRNLNKIEKQRLKDSYFDIHTPKELLESL